MYCNASITMEFVVRIDDAAGKKAGNDVLAPEP
jgi:hypothetical protein